MTKNMKKEDKLQITYTSLFQKNTHKYNTDDMINLLQFYQYDLQAIGKNQRPSK